MSSPLSRAWETCGLAGLARGAQRNQDLVEWDYGSYEGRTTADIRSERPGWSLWTDGVVDGEAMEEVGARADRVIAAIAETPGDVALVAHGHLLRVLAARWLGMEPSGGRAFGLSPATISVLGWERETPVVLLWNDGAHLDG